MKQKENNRHDEIDHQMVCPTCDRTTKAIDTTDFRPAIVRCKCGYSDTGQDLNEVYEANEDESRNDSGEPVWHEMYCPVCDDITAAILSPDFHPAIIECERCHYSELASG